MICGVDEAGRGPIIGPMVMAAVAVDDESLLPAGLKDSKLLSPQKREELYEKVILLPHAVSVVSVEEIDEWVSQGKLNWLEAKHTIQMLLKLSPKKAIIDCPARNLETYKAHIQKSVPNMDLIVQFKADAEHRVVAAASIIAKVTRDRIIEEIKKETGFDFGSGYLTDPKTQELMKSFDPAFPHYRKSWRPYKDLLAKKQQKSLF